MILGPHIATLDGPPEAFPPFVAADRDLVKIHEGIALAMPLECALGATAAGKDPEASVRELEKIAPSIIVLFSKLKALSMVKAKVWNLIASFVNNALKVKVIPRSSESNRYFNDMVALFSNNATAVRNIDDHTSSLSMDAAYCLGLKAGYPHYWKSIEDGLKLKKQTAAPGFRASRPDAGLSGDSNHLNRKIRKESHNMTSLQLDMLNMAGVPRVMDCILLLVTNTIDQRDQIEAHGGETSAWICDTGKTVGGDLKVRHIDVSFKGAFPGSTPEREVRGWTVYASLNNLRANGFIRGNWVKPDGGEPLSPKIAMALQRNDRPLRLVLGRALRIRWHGPRRAGGIKAAPVDENEVPWDPAATSLMIDGGNCITPVVLQAIMATAIEAYIQMVEPLVLHALIPGLQGGGDCTLLKTIVIDGTSLLVVEKEVTNIGRRLIVIEDGSGLKIGDMIESSGMNSDQPSIAELRTTTQQTISVRSVLSGQALVNLRTCIADAHADPGFLSPVKVVRLISYNLPSAA